MDTVDFVGNVATNVAADWTQALIAPLGIVGWKACRGAWDKRPRGIAEMGSLVINGRWWRSSKNWAAMALYPMVFLPYAIASTIWFSPFMLLAGAPIASFLRGADGELPDWLTVLFFMLCMTPVALISFERLFLRDSPLTEAVNLYIDGIAVWIFILAGCAFCAVGFLPLVLLCRLFQVPINSGLMVGAQLIFVCACVVIFAALYWLGCLFIARGRLLPGLLDFLGYIRSPLERMRKRKIQPPA